MILLKDLLTEVQPEFRVFGAIPRPRGAESDLTVYRGVKPGSRDINLGINSTKIGDKLVATLGPNYTDNIEVAKKFGTQIITTKLTGSGLELSHYNDIIRLYKEYEHMLPVGLASKIKISDGQEQLNLIQLAGKQLRNILSKKYGYIKSPLAISDANYLTQKGLTGDLYIPLR
jgi:hypothetical protein